MTPANRNVKLSSWIGPILVAVVGLVMTFVIWDRGPDPVLDFGRELYIPWRINNGDVLYRDIEYFNGPFSPYFNSLVFRVFGTSLDALTTFNLLIVILATVLIYALLLRVADHVGATAGCCAFLICCALANRTDIPNFNFLTPYSHELPHGIVMTYGMIACLFAAVGSKRVLAWIAPAGFLLGLVFLTKAEVFLAAVVTAIIGVGIALWLTKATAKQIALTVAILLGCALVPILVAFLLLAHASTAPIALHGLAGSWPWIGNQQLMQLPYFRSLLGTDDIPRNLTTIGIWTIVYAAVVVGAWLIARLEPKRAVLISIIAAVGIGAVTLGASPWIHWENFLRPLPLLLLIACIWLARNLWRCTSDLETRRRIMLRLLLTIFGGMMLAKMVLNVSLFHYGFALAMPGLVVLVVAMVSWLPRAIGAPMRFLSLGLLVAMLIVHAHITWQRSEGKVVPVGSGGDAFFADGRGLDLDYLLQDLQSLPRDKTLTMMPEGLIANYLSRRVNPSRYSQFTPPNLIMYGEGNMLKSLKSHPPDYIALVHIRNVEYGAPFFGKDYALNIARWVEQNYHQVHLIGQMPFEEDTGFGIRLMQKNDRDKDEG
jgi:hypothetical protein